MKKIFLTLLMHVFLGTSSNAQSGASCNASFTTNSVCATLPANFTDLSTFATGDSIIKEIWIYGDGTVDTLFNTFNSIHTHTYSYGKIYTASLMIFTKSGCSSNYMNIVTIKSNPAETDSFHYSQLPGCTTPFAVQFQFPFVGNGSASRWDFGDGTVINDSTPVHFYASPGNYKVTLIARIAGCTNRDTSTKIVTVSGSPAANFNYIQDSGSSKKINFTDQSNGGYGNTVKWFWDFGDGDTSVEQNPSHIYLSTGFYTVNHFITSSIGCISDTISHPVYVDSNYNPNTTGTYKSNFGKDFWAGFGYEERMSHKVTDGSDGANMILYITGGDIPSVATVSLPGMPLASGFPKIVSVPAHTIVSITGFPRGDVNDALNYAGFPDARLYYTGISDRAIHITSTQPVAVWQYIYAINNSAGATLLLPTDMWSNTYTAQTWGNKTNTGTPNSFFYVIAQQDNTQINFIPSCDISDSSGNTIFTGSFPTPPSDILYHANVPYTITLNKGQVFNTMSIISSDGSGEDLSGTVINSPDPTKKIAVFAGNGRVLIGSSICTPTAGSDNLIQQMFPQIAWGTKYLTVPTKSMEYNIYRITVADSSTAVSVNGNILPVSSLINHSYYQVEGNGPDVISADKKIMVTQYIIAGQCTNIAVGNNGTGDPEMIILSPVTNISNNITLYSPTFQDGFAGGSYINVVVKKEGVASFLLDGAAVADTGNSSFTTTVYGSSGSIPITTAFNPHPGDPGYYYARFKVSYPAVHTLSSDSGFNAIAYGMASGESYGYNAGFILPYQYLIYKFIGNGNWDEASNWQDGQVPPADLPIGSEIIIAGNCVLNVQQILEQGSTLTVLSGAKLTVNDNLLIQK